MSATSIDKEATHLAEITGLLIGHGLDPKPTGLLVTGENGKTAIIMCHARPDDGDRMWFCVAGGPWLGEAKEPTWALTALKSHLNGGETPE